MFKMVIADDEHLVREGLRTVVAWEDYGIEIVGEASDGEETLELCKELTPDILFTDIRMPLIDGLEVAMKLKEINSDIKIIIISGVQDFNYVKTALDINADGYILKPIKIDELHTVITKVVNSIIMERNIEQEMELLKNQIKESVPAIRENFLRSLISGIYRYEEEICEKSKYLKIPFEDYENCISAIVQIDNYREVIRDKSEENKQLLIFSVVNVVKRVLQGYNAGICFIMNENEVVIIFNKNAQIRKKYISICEEIMSCVAKLTCVTISIGVGNYVNTLSQIHTSYKEALEVLKYKFYTRDNSLLCAEDFDLGFKDINHSNLYELEKQLIDYMKLGDRESVSETIDEIFQPICINKKLHSSYVQSICIELIFTASRVVYETNENIEKIVDSHANILNEIYAKENVYQLKDYILTVFLKISDYFANKYNQKNTTNIARIKEIVNNRYMENISISDIAEEVYLSPNYMSLIFKNETRETIVEYITRVRIEAAKDLLKSTNLKMFEVAQMVGYENPQYFSTVFKKYTGIYPMKYRKFSCGNLE